MVFIDFLLELQAACREVRLEKYQQRDSISIGTYAQAVHAAILSRELYADVFPVRNSILNACSWVETRAYRNLHDAVKREDWPEARRWMRTGVPLVENKEPGRVYAEIAKQKPDELATTVRGAYADVLRGMFACSCRFLRIRDWQRAWHLVEKLKFTLDYVDLHDVGGTHNNRCTPLLLWEARVQPFLLKEPRPWPYEAQLLADYGADLRNATPLHPDLLRAALFATHPRSAKTSRLASLPLTSVQAILRFAAMPRNKW